VTKTVLFSLRVCIVICVTILASDRVAKAQLQSGPQTRTFLTRVINIGTSTNGTLWEHVGTLRKQDVLVGLEIDLSTPMFQDRPSAFRKTTFDFSHETLGGILEKLAAEYTNYTSRLDKEVSFVNIFPKHNPVSTNILGPCYIKARSVEDIFANNIAGLKGRGVSDLFGPPRGRPFYQDLIVDSEFKGGTVMEFLNRLSLAIGDGVSWNLEAIGGKGGVHFHFEKPLRDLASYKPEESYPIPVRLQKRKDLLSKAQTDKERVELLKQIASLYSQAGDKQSAAQYLDEAIRIAPTDEDKCLICASRVWCLHNPTPKAEAERMLQAFLEIVQTCPYESSRLHAILSAAWLCGQLDREDEGVALLKEAARDYPDKLEAIRGQMKMQFRSHLDELPTPPSASTTWTNGFPPEFYQRFPTTNPPPKTIYFPAAP
jgi:tetratricopeptide (TPR) repeat protein